MFSRMLAVPILATAALAVPRPAVAQMLSTWGNPVISIGLTPYHATSVGHGWYPGSNGFIPGYGYYPGNFESRYPWLNGPDSFDYTRTPPRGKTPPDHAILAESPLPPHSALLTLRVPTDAAIWIAGNKTEQQGDLRTFVTPSLPPGRIFSYEIRARWKQDGQPIEQTKEVDVRSDDRLTVDFRAASARPEEAPPPRKLRTP